MFTRLHHHMMIVTFKFPDLYKLAHYSLMMDKSPASLYSLSIKGHVSRYIRVNSRRHTVLLDQQSLTQKIKKTVEGAHPMWHRPNHYYKKRVWKGHLSIWHSTTNNQAGYQGIV
ncbi:hypothetical protein ACQJBY_055670 [Aegilops geniculata]